MYGTLKIRNGPEFKLTANVKPFMTTIILDRMCFGSNIAVLMHFNLGCWCTSRCEPNLPACSPVPRFSFHICTFYTHCFKYILILSVQLYLSFLYTYCEGTFQSISVPCPARINVFNKVHQFRFIFH